METIEQIGAYAGLASVVGLAVLAALYFSQARDVRRLREWAGRAPERGGVPGGVPAPYQRAVAQPQRVVPQRVPSPAAAVAQGTARPGPVRPAATGQGPVTPGTTPPRAPVAPGGGAAPVRAAAAGAAPTAATGPPTATPAAARMAAGEDRNRAPGDKQEGVSQDTMLHPPPSPPGETGRDEGRDADELEADEGEVEGERAAREALEEEELAEERVSADDEVDAEDPEYDDELDQDEGLDDEAGDTGDAPALAQSVPPPPPPPPTIPSRPPPPMPAGVGSQPRQGPILPPYASSRPGDDQPWYGRGLASRAGVLAIGATLFIVALVAVAVLQFGDDRRTATKQEQAAPSGDAGSGGEPRNSGQRSAVVPARVTVSVLNGTTVGGLARELGDKLQDQGFRLGNVTNSTDQQRAESVVLFAPGGEREAAEVGRRLKIDQREPIDPESQTLAGDAGVVVIAGADLTR